MIPIVSSLLSHSARRRVWSGVFSKRKRAFAAAALGVFCALACQPSPDETTRHDRRIEPDGTVEDLAERLAPKLAALDLDAVSVTDFRDLRNGTSELGRYLAQEVASALTAACAETPDAPRVIDRHRNAETLEERGFEALGLVAPDERRQGKIGGVDAQITAKIVSFADVVEIQIQVLEYGDDAAILIADWVRLARTPQHNELETRTLEIAPGSDPDRMEIRADGPPLQSWRASWRPKLQVDLQGCGRMLEEVICTFSLQALGRDRTASIYDSSRAILADGTQVASVWRRLGPTTIAGPKGRAGGTVTQEVPMIAALRFAAIPPDVHRIEVLRLALHGADATFEDIPIDRY